MGNKNQQKKNFKNNKNQKNNKPQHNRSENLSTSIGDLLKAKGMMLPKADKVDEPVAEKVEPKKQTIEDLKANGIDLSKVAVTIDMNGTTEPEEKTIDPENLFPYESSVENLVGAFLAEPEEEKVEEKSVTRIHVGAEYVTMDGTDKKVRTDTFINK